MRTLKCAMIVASLGLAIAATPLWAASFSPGNVVVYRVGTGSGNLVNTGNPVFLDEYTPTGTLVQSVPMPTTTSGANLPLISSGTAQSEGLLTRSADGRYLLLTGYGTTTGGSTSLKNSSAAAVNRVVGRVDMAGNVDTTTALTDFADGDTPRSVASSDGADLWVTGNVGGVRYATLGSTTSVSLTSLVSAAYQVNIFGGQLYATTRTSPNFLVSIGTGLPESGDNGVLPVLPAGNSLTSPDAFCFLDVDPTTPGLDTIYVADDANGIMKYCLSGSDWVFEGKKGSGNNAYRGLTGSVQNDGSVLLYSTREGGGGATGGGKLVSLLDDTGFGGNIANAGGFTVRAEAASYTAFRGVAFAPVPEPSTFALLIAGLVAMLVVRRRSC
jgi:hypothetical protein